MARSSPSRLPSYSRLPNGILARRSCRQQGPWRGHSAIAGSPSWRVRSTRSSRWSIIRNGSRQTRQAPSRNARSREFANAWRSWSERCGPLGPVRWVLAGRYLRGDVQQMVYWRGVARKEPCQDRGTCTTHAGASKNRASVGAALRLNATLPFQARRRVSTFLNRRFSAARS